MLVTIKRIFFLPNTILFSLLLLFLISFTPVLAANVLTNPSFTGGTTGWTLSSLTYNSSTYQDTAGSVQGYAIRKENITGTAVQSSYVSINSVDIVTLSGWWKNTIAGSANITFSIEAAEQSTPTTWVPLWSSGVLSASNDWTQVNNLDVSSYFGTGSYRLQLKMVIYGGSAVGSEGYGWLDNLNLDVITPTVTTAATGTQVSTVNTGETGKYIGGAFTMASNTGSINVNSIQISEAGTLNANTYLHNVKLFYETAATCTYDGVETQYGTTTSFNTSEDATFSTTLAVTTSQICFYVVFDIDQNATDSASIEVEITNPSTDVTVDSGYGSSPGTTVSIAGTTTVTTVASISITLTTDGSVSWGIMQAGSSKSTISISDTEVVQSNSNVNIDLDIKSTNAIGGSVNWTLGSSAGNDIFVYEHSSNSGSVWNTFLLADSYYTFVTGMIPDATQNIDLRITVPSVSTEYTQKTITVTILATQSL